MSRPSRARSGCKALAREIAEAEALLAQHDAQEDTRSKRLYKDFVAGKITIADVLPEDMMLILHYFKIDPDTALIRAELDAYPLSDAQRAYVYKQLDWTPDK